MGNHRKKGTNKLKQNFFEIDEKIQRAADEAIAKTEPQFKKIAEISEYNQQKVLSAFIKNGVSESMFASSTGSATATGAEKRSIRFLPTL